MTIGRARPQTKGDISMPALPPLLNVENPAETMRRAAALMRERAGLVPPPPWFSAVHDVTTHDGLNVIASSGLTVRAEYVASWHPDVALAVADWLDNEAVNAPGPGDVYLRGGRIAYALTVACAYLGEG
jgi:hypothetical protein